MKKKLPSILPLLRCSSQTNLHNKEISFFKTKFSLLFLFVFASSMAQNISHTYTTNTSVFVPPGLSTMTVQAWGAGGAGGGSSVPGTGFGRGGAGGGGGAYATATISVSTLTNTNINAVVGAQTAGTTGIGANGGSSTITGFESVILAVGGSGGTANTAGGTPAGGTGGQASASVGNPATKTSGGNGDPGGTSLLSLLFSSGKGGAGGAPGGGAGGAAIASVVLGVNSVGNDGAGPGGGGGGAMTAGTGGPLAGGAGAPGQIKIDYTCPTYSITGVSAANACTSAGTSLVTLTGSAASLPIGTYTVTYNRSSPAGTALTATLTVAVAGTGTFTAVGLTAAGTPTITVTNLAAGECTSTIGSNNIGNVTVFGPTAGGAVTGTSPVCSGATSGLLTLSGHTGTILNWESSVSPFSTWTNIVNTTSTYTSGPLTATTQFRAVVQNGPCASSPSTPVTITVNPLPQGSLTANGPFCATGAGQLTFTATAGTGPYTIVYKENGGADRTATNISSGTPFATFTTPVTASTTYTLVSVTGANTCVRSASFTGGSATITVNPLPQGSLTANGPFCATGAGQLTFTATAGTGPYTVVYKENGGPDRTATNVISGTPFATFTTPVISSTTYTLVSVTGANTCVRSASFTGGSATITVNPLPQGSLTANGPFCATGAGQLTFTATAGTGPYTIVYKENGGADQTATNVTSGTPFATFTTPVTASTTYTLVSVTGANTCVRSASFTGGSAIITVNPLPQGSLTANGPFCATGAGQLTFTATAGTGPYTIVYKENGGADQTATNVTSGTPFATFTTPVITSTTYTLVSVTGALSCFRNSGFTGGSATITVNPLPQGSLTANGPFCGTGAGQLTFTATAGTGPYTIVYKENGGADQTATNVTSGTPFATFTTPVITSTTYTLVSVTGANTCARNSAFTGGSAAISISPLPTAPINSGLTQPTCAVQTGTLVLTGLPNISNYTIVQTGSSLNNYTGVSGPDPTTYVITGLPAGTYNFTVQYAGSCVSPPLSNITINPLITNTYTTLGGWSNGTPTINQNVVFADNYSITGDLNSCTCKVNPGIKITVTALNTLTINNALIVDSAAGTELIFENNSSLIQINNNPVMNSGNITYKRTAKQMLWGDYVYWSTPVSPQKLIDLSPLTLSDKFFGFNGDNWVITSPNDFMTVGKGYIIRGPQTYSTSLRQDYTASFTGVPNNGNLSGENMAAGKFYLIGNPYPSALDADLFLDANLFLDGTIFLWNHNTPVGTTAQYQYSDDDYASYNTSGGVGTSAKSSPGHTDNPATDAGVKPTGNIAAGQSFFAQATTSGLATFNNTMRIGGASNNQFFKTANTSKKADLERHRLWLNMTNEGGAFKQLLVGYIEEATNGNDNRFDGITLDANPYLDFYSINGTYKYVIQGRALPFSDKDVVPLGYRSAIISDFTIAIDDSDGDLEYQAIYIEDKVTGLVHNLRDSNYTFSSVVGTFDDRFILRYTNTSLGTDEFENSGKQLVISMKNKIISINASDKMINEILIYDMTGNLIYRKANLNDPAFQIVNLRSQNQVLLVKVKLADNSISTQKVIF
ncbi:T9SS sorting signal type C domain-containing protein [Flavobacterium sp. ENC]|uniref:T9SS sorting signal type C domain-containing protein n=1 Tax=Flavobacterium sp. ENC TaxID=2897330 RepID=UPI001E3A359A|nr:T9SS sorting signal type C domain-containing protein [Flavobacterium sp. ENC]MCD0464572.1 T9SS sorting signal type C domain-containing protein [Flavobacterium sp. ENC]